MRPLQAKDDRRDSGSSTSELPKSYGKRRCVSSACIPCRKRKSKVRISMALCSPEIGTARLVADWSLKCDGEQPTCSTCTAVYKTPCFFDSDGDHKRKSALNKDIALLKGEKESLIAIIKAIKSYPDAKVAGIVQLVRTNENLDVIAEELRKNATLPDISDISLRGESNQFIGRAAFDNGTIRAYGLSSNLGLASEEETRPTQLTHPEDWTLVTREDSFIRNLLKMYFLWVHPFYCFFSDRLFWEDFHTNQTGHCSSLLVNAILAVACHYSDRPEARSNPHDHSTAGDHFFAEAVRLLNQHDTADLTTVQALALMGLREPSVSRPNSGFRYSGRCMRMLVELGLHLSINPDDFELDPRELEARKITFWACYNYDT